MTWALHSLCRPSAMAHLLTTGQGAMVVLPDSSRAPSGGGSAGRPLLPVYTSRRQRWLVHRTQLRRSPGAWGPSATNKRHRVYTGALLATTTVTVQPSHKFSQNFFGLSIKVIHKAEPFRIIFPEISCFPVRLWITLCK